MLVNGSESHDPRRDLIDSGAIARVDALVSNERRRRCLEEEASVTMEAVSREWPTAAAAVVVVVVDAAVVWWLVEARISVPTSGPV